MAKRFPDITKNHSRATRIITGPSDLTPEWVTALLHQRGVAQSASVSAVEVILQKHLQVSTVCRLGISYKEPVDENYPRSLFLKIPRVLSDEDRLALADGEAEIEFYKNIAPRIGSPPLVECYDAAYSEETGRSHIILEDLFETHFQPEQEHAPSFEMSRLAVEALARAHAKSWNSPTMRRGEFELQSFVENLKTSVEEFLKVAELTAEQEGEYRKMLDAADVIWGQINRRDHVTITHGDMHWWNFLYPKDATTSPVYIIDWHLWHIDLGARDLAFLLALGGFAESRPEIEAELLRSYHKALDVEDYTWEMLREDYRWSAIRNLNIPVIFWSQGKHESTWRTALRRAWESYVRLDCGSLIVDR